jgi:hypothetical protein
MLATAKARRAPPASASCMSGPRSAARDSVSAAVENAGAEVSCIVTAPVRDERRERSRFAAGWWRRGVARPVFAPRVPRAEASSAVAVRAGGGVAGEDGAGACVRVTTAAVCFTGAVDRRAGLAA